MLEGGFLLEVALQEFGGFENRLYCRLRASFFFTAFTMFLLKLQIKEPITHAASTRSLFCH